MTGCVAPPKALVDLPAEHRRAVRFVPLREEQTRARFVSNGATTAREFGGIVGFAVAASIEHSTNGYGDAAAIIGTFEAAAVQDLFLKRLQSMAIATDATGPEAARLSIKIGAVGLREVERGRFTPFIQVSSRLTGSDAKELWLAHAQSTGVRARPLREFQEQPELYRQDFGGVAEDVVNQLVEGPIRAVTF
jgi:hypothetical protein